MTPCRARFCNSWRIAWSGPVTSAHFCGKFFNSSSYFWISSSTIAICMDSLIRIDPGRQVAMPDAATARKLHSHTVVLFCSRERVKPSITKLIKLSLTCHLSRPLPTFVDFLRPLRDAGRPLLQMIHMPQAGKPTQGRMYLSERMFCQHLILHVAKMLCLQMCVQSRPVPGGFHRRHTS